MDTKKKKKKKKMTISTALQDSNIVNIESYKDEEGNFKVSSNENTYFSLPFFIDKSIFYNTDEYNRFIKAVEKFIRTSKYYKNYIASLKMNYGLNYCMIMGNIDDTDGVDIEMHHGPLLNLYDIVSIVTNHMIMTGQHVNTFRVAKVVLEEHYKQHIQVIMLSKTVHELVHKGKIFIHPSQCIGDINAFLDDYHLGMTDELAEGINKYLEMCDKFNTTDNGLLKFNGVKSWNKQDTDNTSFMDNEKEGGMLH